MSKPKEPPFKKGDVLIIRKDNLNFPKQTSGRIVRCTSIKRGRSLSGWLVTAKSQYPDLQIYVSFLGSEIALVDTLKGYCSSHFVLYEGATLAPQSETERNK